VFSFLPCSWLLSLHLMLFKFIHFVKYASNIHNYTFLLSNIPFMICTFHNLFIHSPADEHLGYFQLLVRMKLLRLFICVLLCGNPSFSEKYIRLQLLDYILIVCLLSGCAILQSCQIHLFYILTITWYDWSAFMFLSININVSLWF
jgi:hypothetical protein